MNQPPITLGLPVYNGERFIRDAVLSALSQTYERFELIISDNASSDRTETICRELAARDGRIRYIRRSTNVGAGPNFNGVVALSRSEYFKWLAHDDLMAPTFLERCVDALEADRSAVLACPRVRFINAEGAVLDDYVSPFQTGSLDRAVRFGDMFRGHRCFEVFGLIRLRELRRTHLIGPYNHGDGVLLTHLALLGRFADVPEPLYYSRKHDQQSMFRFGITSGAGVDLDGYARWFDPKNGTVPRSFNKMLVEYLWMIRQTPMSNTERLECYRTVFRWFRVSWRIIAGEWKRTLCQSCGIVARPSRRERMPV